MHPNFADKSLWEIVPNVPVLDEHRLVDQGREIHVDSARLQRIADNTNRRFARTGDAVALIVGHTEDGQNAQERPVVGWAKDLRVGPFVDGKKAIYADFYYRKSKANVVGDFPRRSVELWLGKDEIDPIALLGGTTPERDLGVVLKYSRRAGKPVRVYRRLFPESTVSNQHRPNGQPKRVPARGQVRYELDEDFDGDDAPPPIDDTPAGANDAGQDMATFKAMLLKLLPEILPEVLAQMGVGDDAGMDGLGMGGPGADDGMGGMGGCPGPGCPGCPGCQDMAGGDMGAGLPPGPGDGEMSDDPEMDSRVEHEGDPVKFDAMGSGTNGFIPSDQECDRMVSMSRDGRRSSQRQTRPARSPAGDDAPVTRVQYNRLLDRLGQSEAEKAVAMLESEGVDFGSAEDKAAEIGLLARLSRMDADGGTDHFSGQVEKCRRMYKRQGRQDQPADAMPAYLRYGRQPDRQPDPVAAAHVTAAEVVKFQRQMTRSLGRHVGWAEAKSAYEQKAAASTTAVTQTR